MSLRFLVSGVPATTKRFSLTENWAITKMRLIRVFGKLKIILKMRLKALTLWSLKMDNGVVVLEHVDFINILKRLHTELFDG